MDIHSPWISSQIVVCSISIVRISTVVHSPIGTVIFDISIDINKHPLMCIDIESTPVLTHHVGT